MKLFKKAAALILAAAISVTALQATSFADDSATGTEYVELAFHAAKKPAKTTLTVTATRSGYTFSWKKVSGIKEYEIYASKDNGRTFERIATAKSSKTSVTVKTLDISLSYIFKIRSYKLSSGKKVYSKFSNPVTIKAVTEAATVTMGKSTEANTSVTASKKQLDLITVPVSKINKNLAYVTDYLGKDLYVIKEKDSEQRQIYKVTKSALRSYKATGKLKALKIDTDTALDGLNWSVYATRVDSVNIAVLTYVDKNGDTVYATAAYDPEKESFRVTHTTTGMAVLTTDGYTLDCYRTTEQSGEEVRVARVDIILPDGRLLKRVLFREEEDCDSAFAAKAIDSGVWYTYYSNGYCRNRWIDKTGQETVYLSGLKYGWQGSKNYLLYYPIDLRTSKDKIPLAEGSLLLLKENKTYSLADFDVLSMYSYNELCTLDRLDSINGKMAVAAYESGRGESKYALMNLSTGKLRTPVYDYMEYCSKSKMYVAYTQTIMGRSTAVWYYNKDGKKLAKFDDGTVFTKDGYALVSSGKKLFMVNKNFERVTSNLKFSSSKGFSCTFGEKGILTYYTGNNGYFVVYA